MVTQLGAMPVTSSPGAAAVAAVSSSNSPATAALPPGEQGQPSRRSAAENRRSNKPIMEKKRRARINNCLNELKTLILDAMKKDPARHSKLEKADILEMTVKHLETLQRQQSALVAATDPAVLNKFRAGFNECINEVGRFPGLETNVRRRLVQHLSCVNAHMGAAPGGAPPAQQQQQPQQQPLQVHILPAAAPPVVEPSVPPTPVSTATTTTAGIFLSNGGVPLVPTRLPNGDLALVLPSSYRAAALSPAPSSSSTSSSSSSSSSSASSASSPIPMLVPIPNRTPSSDSPPVSFERLQVNAHHSPASSPKPISPRPVLMSSPTPVIMSSPTPVIMSPPSTSVPSPSMPMVIDDRAYSPPLQKPLSLVMRRTVCRPQDHHWRPW